jgi:hypothetical protein
MNTEFGSLTTIANPFAAFLSPDIVMAAHERLASRVLSTVHRPLDKPMLPRVGYENLAELDAEVDGEDDVAANFGALN